MDVRQDVLSAMGEDRQSLSEGAGTKVLHQYLVYAKHQFPMLLPQPRIGIAERRRPDFVAFVPL